MRTVGKIFLLNRRRNELGTAAFWSLLRTRAGEFMGEWVNGYWRLATGVQVGRRCLTPGWYEISPCVCFHHCQRKAVGNRAALDDTKGFVQYPDALGGT